MKLAANFPDMVTLPGGWSGSLPEGSRESGTRPPRSARPPRAHSHNRTASTAGTVTTQDRAQPQPNTEHDPHSHN
ncbi:hypothetical protein GCM10010335_31250 [Streptomyces galbus]|nr:hypothetical protein GCM10010335_31250 [Streptomyces galbus]